MSASESYDLIIAGGGTTGITLALALARSTDLSIAIIEASDEGAGKYHPAFDARSVALAHGSAQIYQAFGVDITGLGTPIEHIHVSDRGHLGQCQLHRQDYQVPALGYVVELGVLGRALSAKLQGVGKRVHWYRPDAVQAVARTKDNVTVTTQQGKTLSARLLVIAEGGRSGTRTLLGIEPSVVPYDQFAIIANVGLQNSHRGWAFERFTQSGPLAMLPLEGAEGVEHRCSLVWTVEAPEYQRLMDMSEDAFLKALQSAFGYRLGPFVSIGKRDSYPLSLIRAETVAVHRTLVLGNASQSLHPIAGQGLNLALRDIYTCVSLLTDMQHNDIGSFALVNAYKQHRAEDQTRVIGLTDGLVRIFSNDYFPLVMGRNIGLSVMNGSAALKFHLAQQAMGLTSTLSTGAK